MSFEVESFFRGTTIDTSLLTTFPDLAEKRVGGRLSDLPILRLSTGPTAHSRIINMAVICYPHESYCGTTTTSV